MREVQVPSLVRKTKILHGQQTSETTWPNGLGWTALSLKTQVHLQLWNVILHEHKVFWCDYLRWGHNGLRRALSPVAGILGRRPHGTQTHAGRGLSEKSRSQGMLRADKRKPGERCGIGSSCWPLDVRLRGIRTPGNQLAVSLGTPPSLQGSVPAAPGSQSIQSTPGLRKLPPSLGHITSALFWRFLFFFLNSPWHTPEGHICIFFGGGTDFWRFSWESAFPPCPPPPNTPALSAQDLCLVYQHYPWARPGEHVSAASVRVSQDIRCQRLCHPVPLGRTHVSTYCNFTASSAWWLRW